MHYLSEGNARAMGITAGQILSQMREQPFHPIPRSTPAAPVCWRRPRLTKLSVKKVDRLAARETITVRRTRSTIADVDGLW